MIKALLIGDSIRMSYHGRVRELLQGRAEVHGPEENCRFAAFTLFSLSSWAPDHDYDVIHWNNGQWDTCYMPDGRIHTAQDLYVDLHQRIAAILRPKTKRLVFATTSPVHPDQYRLAAINGRKNEDIVAYNQAVTRALTATGVEINDLHAALAADVPRYISDDRVHLSPDGIELCAGLVAGKLLGPEEPAPGRRGLQ